MKTFKEYRTLSWGELVWDYILEHPGKEFTNMDIVGCFCELHGYDKIYAREKIRDGISTLLRSGVVETVGREYKTGRYLYRRIDGKEYKHVYLEDW